MTPQELTNRLALIKQVHTEMVARRARVAAYRAKVGS